MVHQKGQLRENGKLGAFGGFCFVDAVTVIDRLAKDKCNALISVGNMLNNREEMPVSNSKAIRWVNENSGSYAFEAWYDGKVPELHVSAMCA